MAHVPEGTIKEKKRPYAARHDAGPHQYLVRFARFTALFLAALLVVAFFVIFAEAIRERVLTSARAVTGGGDRGMAVAGWLLVLVPLWFGAAGLLVFPRLPAKVVVAWIAAAVLLLVPAATFAPGRGTHIEDLISGPGVAGFATGLRWAAWNLVSLVAALFLTDDTRFGGRRGLGLLAVTVTGLGSLVIVLIRAS
ncbi:MAG: hypothetical protein ABW046_20170 [Actinoplanes sp.]